MEDYMNPKTEGALAIVAAFIVLFSAMWDPRISAGISVVALAAFGVYRFTQKKQVALASLPSR
jgi:predicted branched-subunit amino acid permease